MREAKLMTHNKKYESYSKGNEKAISKREHASKSWECLQVAKANLS